MNKPIGMLFDLDGVLIDTETEYTKIWTRICERFPSEYPDVPQRIKGTTLDSILNNYFADHKEEVVEMLFENEARMNYEWLPGSKEFIQWLIDMNIPRALVTSSNDEKMSHLKKSRPEIVPYMQAVITGDQISHSKPNPEGYLLGAKLIDRNPRNCAVFEDSLQGVMAGHAAGAYVVGVIGTMPEETIAPYCDITVHSLDEIDRNQLLKILSER